MNKTSTITIHQNIVLLFALVTAISGCVNSSEPEQYPLSQTIESSHFTYHMSVGDNVYTARQEAFYDWITTTLNLVVPRKLEYFKYRDRDHLYRITRRQTNGFAELGTYNFHTIWNWDNHECTHSIISNLVGVPVALFNEGIAVAHQTDPLNGRFEPFWNMVHIHDLSKGYLQRGEIPPLDTLLESSSFFSFDDSKTYPLAGSFVRFLIDSAGLESMKLFIGKSSIWDTKLKAHADFQAVYGSPIEVWWNRWLGFLAERYTPYLFTRVRLPANQALKLTR
jgi:hypothetical protein